MTEQKFFVFSLSEKDEAFSHKDMGKAVSWLRDKKEEKNPLCKFAEKSPRDVPSGSIILFSFDAQIFGQATLKGTKKEVPLKEQEARRKAEKTVYKHFVFLEPTKIEIFPQHPTKKEISEKLNKNFSPLFTYFTHEEYQKILKMAKKR